LGERLGTQRVLPLGSPLPLPAGVPIFVAARKLHILCSFGQERAMIESTQQRVSGYLAREPGRHLRGVIG
jgi:hypothetical protein